VETKVVTLINGAQVAEATVGVVFLSLDLLATRGHYMAIYELFQLCQNPSHQLFGNAGSVLKQVGLLETWYPATEQARIHADVRAIVLAAVTNPALGSVRVAAGPLSIIREANE
jgi:hypothetical protein